MSGTKNDVLVGKNADFSQADAPNSQSSESNGLVTNGDLWIGSTALNAGSTHVNVGNITSSSLTIGYSSPDITIETNGGGSPIEQVTVDNSTLPGTNPVLPTGSGNITITGGQVVNASLTNVIQTHSLAANSFAVQIQRSAAAAAADTTKNGVAHFDSADFAVAASGFVTLAGGGAGQTITGDSGGALSPTAGNWNILGLSGSKTSGSGSTLTVKSPPYADQGGSTTVTLNSGSFATAAITLTTPATAGLADGDLLEFVATNGVLVIQLAATQVAHLGAAATTAAGTITSTATGDSISLRYQASTNDWWATSSIGAWVLA